MIYLNKIVRLRTCLFACLLTMLCTIAVMGSTTMEKITAYINKSINIVIDGEVVELKGSNGERVYPITYNGITYLPIRNISEIFDFKVDWDGKKGNVIIDTKVENRESLITNETLSTKNTKILGLKEDRTFTINENSFVADNGISCNILASQDYKSKDFLSFNIKDKYKGISFDCLSPIDCSVNVFNQNGKLIKSFQIKPNILTHCNCSFISKDITSIYFVCISQNTEVKNQVINILNLYGEMQ